MKSGEAAVNNINDHHTNGFSQVQVHIACGGGDRLGEFENIEATATGY
jgi:hypothetical protein